MKKLHFIALLLSFTTTVKTQSLLDDPLFYQFLGKQQYEMQRNTAFPYFNYTLSRIHYANVSTGGMFSSGYRPVDSYLNGKGSAILFSPGTSGTYKKIHSVVGNDGSLMNGGVINFYTNKTRIQHLSISGNHRYLQKKTDRNSDGFMDQPLKNDLHLNLDYVIYINDDGDKLNIGYTRTQEHTLAGEDSLDYLKEKNISSVHRFENNITSDHLYLSLAVFGNKKQQADTRDHKSILINLEGVSVKQDSYFSTHAFSYRQRSVVSKIKYAKGNTSDLFRFSIAAELRLADTEEKFDSLTLSPLSGSTGLVATSYFRFSPRFNIELNNRSDYFFVGKYFLHNPALKFNYNGNKNDKTNAFIYSQVQHRMTDPVAEYLNYISSDKTIYLDTALEADEWWRNGFAFQYTFSWRVFAKIGYYNDHYTLRNVAGIYDRTDMINFYKCYSSNDNVIESEFSFRLFSERFTGKAMHRYYLPQAEINGNREMLPFYSKHSLLAVLNYRDPYDSNEKYPEASLSFFYSSKVITGVNAAQEFIYAKPSFSINARTALPLAFLDVKFNWFLPNFLHGFNFVVSCDNITGHKQHSLYSLAGNGNSNDSVNPWGQFYGRRWGFGLNIDLNKFKRG